MRNKDGSSEFSFKRSARGKCREFYLTVTQDSNTTAATNERYVRLPRAKFLFFKKTAILISTLMKKPADIVFCADPISRVKACFTASNNFIGSCTWMLSSKTYSKLAIL